MSELNEKDDHLQEMTNHLSSIQNSVDTTIQDLGSRNKLVRTSSNIFSKASNDLKDRLKTLQEYSSALCLKKKEIKNQIELFYNDNNKLLKEIKESKTSIEKQIEALEEKSTQFFNQIAQNQKMKDEISNQIMLFDKEEENLDKKSIECQEILSKPVLLNKNDAIIDSIQETQKSLEQIEEQIQKKLNSINEIQNHIQLNQTLKTVNEKFIQTQEDICLVQEKIEKEKSIFQEKQEQLNLILSQVKENNDGINIFRDNLMQIKTINSEIEQEKEKGSQILKTITPVESELRIIEQEYDVENKKEIELAQEFNEIDEKLNNRDPNLVLIEKKMNELEEELRLTLQKKDDLLIIENSLQNEIQTFNQKTLLIKEKISKEITEGAVFYEQKLYKELRALLDENNNMKKSKDELIMMINVLEAEKRRLYKKIVLCTKKTEKYQEKNYQLKKIKSKNKHQKHRLKDLKISIDAIQFKVNELICINEHKKEDIQTKKLSIEQTLLKLYRFPSQESISKTNILNPIVPILDKRGESAKILSKTAYDLKKMYLLQKNIWNDIDQNEITNAFKRWDDTLEKAKPSIEKSLLQAFIELVC